MLRFVILCVVIVGISAEGEPCQLGDACGQGECCYREAINKIYSKRDLSVGDRQDGGDGYYLHGVCERHRTEGESCSVMAKMNGHCGCIFGTRCKADSVRINEEKRDFIRQPKGSYHKVTCQKSNMIVS